MIDKTLEFLVAELNTFLGSRQPAMNQEEHVILAAMSGVDNDEQKRMENKLVVSLVNVQRESAAPVSGIGRRAEGGFQVQAPPLHLNLYVLVAASFANSYPRALAFLGDTMAFFQGKPGFTPTNSAAMPDGLERLSVELVDMNIGELNNLWGILGAKYMPSAVYRVRMLTIDQQRGSGAVPHIGAADAEVRS